MGAALALVPRPADNLRTMAHDALDQWLDQMLTAGGAAPSLLELSEHALTTRHTVLATGFDAIIRERFAADLDQVQAVCGCGRRLARHRLDPRTISTDESRRRRHHRFPALHA
jgi:hypothetical protein